MRNVDFEIAMVAFSFALVTRAVGPDFNLVHREMLYWRGSGTQGFPISEINR